MRAVWKVARIALTLPAWLPLWIAALCLGSTRAGWWCDRQALRISGLANHLGDE